MPRFPQCSPGLPGCRGTGWGRVLACLLGVLGVTELGAGVGIPGSLGRDFNRTIQPLLKQHCTSCHSAEKHKGDLDLERFKNLSDVLKEPKVWEKLVEQVSLGEMPPKDKPPLKPAERERLLGWVNTALEQAAHAHAGDPGPVVLRRLNNAEYTFTVRDLTAVETLDPAREFPGDSAAGEGFMNTGASLVMSPALLTKYYDAGKDIASHAVWLPDGFRFSPKTTRRDWTEEILAEIRGLYREYTDAQGADRVNLQGIVFDTNEGGRLPLERYLQATLVLRDAFPAGPAGAEESKSRVVEHERNPKPARAATTVGGQAKVKLSPIQQRIQQLAAEQKLSARYLESLWALLAGRQPSFLLDAWRARWRAAKPGDVAGLVAEITQWQKVLWKFSSVGHIGKAGGPKAWMEPVSPFVEQQEIRVKLSAPKEGRTVTLYLTAGDAGDGQAGDYVVWKQPRLSLPGRPDLPLREVRGLVDELAACRDRYVAATAGSLAAAAEAMAGTNGFALNTLAERHHVAPDALAAWLDYLGVQSDPVLHLEYLTNRLTKASGYDFVNGWGTGDTPLVLANASDQALRIPGNLKAHGLVMHPSPQRQVGAGWRSPFTGLVIIQANITHAHPECGNGVVWSLEVRRGQTRQRLAAGVSQGGQPVPAGPVERLPIQRGDLVSVLIDPRDGNHSCDLTDVALRVQEVGGENRAWSLADDVTADLPAGNPHADRFGQAAIWHFYTEPVSRQEIGPVIPAGSILAQWQAGADPQAKAKLAEALQSLLQTPAAPGTDAANVALRAQLTSLGGPLLAQVRASDPGPAPRTVATAPAASAQVWGLDPARFGKHPHGTNLDPTSLCVQAPQVVEVPLPAELVAGAEFVVVGTLDPETGAEGSVQLQVTTEKPAAASGLVAGEARVTDAGGAWTSNHQRLSQTSPIIARPGSQARQRIEAGFSEFRQWFPAALCYVKIVPVDEVVTLTLYHREDDFLSRLMLDDEQKQKLDRLWDELHFVSQDALTLVDAFEQLWQYATQDADPKVFEPMRQPIQERAAAFRQRVQEAQPAQLEAVIRFAERAYRRPLREGEAKELRALYQKLRQEELKHEDALRLTLARVFVAPAFLYRLEEAPAGVASRPVTDWELASRLSYFLWSSAPDQELRAQAAAGQLHRPEVLTAQARRLLQDPRTRHLATEFFCTWLHIHDFEALDEKSERHFPTFRAARGALYEEPIQFFMDLCRHNGSVLSVFDADYTFLNEALAKYYGIPGVTGDAWRRVDGMRAQGRGGVLGMGATLAKQSGASRTSPILRGNWVGEVLLGDKLPRPPKDVPRLPEDEAAETLTVRQLVEKHSSDPRCFGCHARIDPFGYALEGFDAIGRARAQDLGGRPIDTRVTLFDGSPVEGAAGLRSYLLKQKREVVLRQFCRKLLGYALGRGVVLTDMPLLSEMQRQLREHDYRLSVAIETIVRSRQFREIRGREATPDS